MKKTENKLLFNKLKDILLKKAEGYFYTEEVCEYQSLNEEDKKEKKVEKSVSHQIDFLNDDVQSKCKENEKREKNKKEDQLILLKKKVTTHHIPPDMLAIKMLFEIYGQEISSSSNLHTLSDDELKKLKEDLIKKLSE